MPSPPSRVSVLKAVSDLFVVKSSGQLCILILLGQFATFRAVDQLFPCHIPHSWLPVCHTLLDFLLPPWLLLLSFLCFLVLLFPSNFLMLKCPRVQSSDLSTYTLSFGDLIWSHGFIFLYLSIHLSSVASTLPEHIRLLCWEETVWSQKEAGWLVMKLLLQWS